MDKPDSLEEALELLNRAAQERRQELRDLIGDRFGALEDLLGGNGPTGSVSEGVAKMRSNIAEYAREAAGNVKEQARKYAKAVDNEVHERPWVFIGAVAAGALILGLVLGSRLGGERK